MEKIALVGATGYLGRALIPYLIEKYHPKTIRLIGRSEWKMAQILRQYGDLYKFKQFRPLICDIRDRERVFSCLKGSDLVIHAAALKRLEICNFNPQEAIKTNVDGSRNVMDACLQLEIPKAIFISSDKAVNATNLYGITKACVESMVVNRAKMVGESLPVMCVVRYGNVIGSTGAVIPYWIQLAKEKKALPMTHPAMTRYVMTKKMALETIGTAIDEGAQAQIVLPKDLKAISMFSAASIINDYFGNPTRIEMIGQFEGEKYHEEIEIGKNSGACPKLSREEFISILKEEGLI